MKLTISKRFDFDAAHFLPKVAEDHKCRRLHGHTYWVEFTFRGEPDERGMVVDYDEIAAVWKVIEKRIDHRLLNEIPGLENPTTEVLAPWLTECFYALALGRGRVALTFARTRVYESSTTWCEVDVDATPGSWPGLDAVFGEAR